MMTMKMKTAVIGAASLVCMTTAVGCGAGNHSGPSAPAFDPLQTGFVLDVPFGGSLDDEVIFVKGRSAFRTELDGCSSSEGKIDDGEYVVACPAMTPNQTLRVPPGEYAFAIQSAVGESWDIDPFLVLPNEIKHVSFSVASVRLPSFTSDQAWSVTPQIMIEGGAMTGANTASRSEINVALPAGSYRMMPYVGDCTPEIGRFTLEPSVFQEVDLGAVWIDYPTSDPSLVSYDLYDAGGSLIGNGLDFHRAYLLTPGEYEVRVHGSTTVLIPTLSVQPLAVAAPIVSG